MVSGQVEILYDVETHRMCHQTIRNHFISHGIPCDSMWNSTWKYLSGLRSKSILIVVVSDLYAFRTTSSDLWCGESLYVPSGTVSFHIEFHVIQCEIPREDNFAKKCSHDVCFGSLCFSDKFRCFVKRKPIECVIWYYYFSFHMEFHVIPCEIQCENIFLFWGKRVISW